MSNRIIKLAILSDLHCHPNRITTTSKNDTYLLTDKLRIPTTDHPVDDLISKIKKEYIEKVDLILCPGDFTDKANIQGFISGWDFSLEIHRALESKEIIATVGNHDVDVYEQYSNYTLDIAKGIKRGFPIDNESDQDIFWSKGCVFLERSDYRILLINSSHFHHNISASKHGQVGDELLDYVKDYLSDKCDEKIQIALSHHPPREHSRANLGEFDKIINGDKLLNILVTNKFDLYIHGHKHDPLISYHSVPGNTYKLPIFSSGSFSSHSNLMFTSIRNTFHLITLKKKSVCKGEIVTWTFFPNYGWSQPDDESGFPAFTGFGSKLSDEEIVKKIINAIKCQKSLTWNEVSKKVPDLLYLTPDQAIRVTSLLREKQIAMDKALRARPTIFYNLSRL